MSASRQRWLCGLLVAWVVAYPESSFAEEACFILNVYDTASYPAEKSARLSVAVSSLDSEPVPEEASIQEFNRTFLQALNESLLDSKFFASVTTAAGDDVARGDYVLEASVLGVQRRNFSGRIWGGGDRMRIGGRLLGPAPSAAGAPRALIARWECAAQNSGGFLGGVLLPAAGNSTRAASNNVKNIAKALTVTLSDKDMKKEFAKKATERTKDASESPLKGATEAERRKWREKRDWEKRDYVDEIVSFVVSSERKRRRGVDALWLTDASYQAHQKLLPLLNLSDALLRPCWPGRGCKDGEEVGRGMLIDLEPVDRLRGKDVYLVALTFSAALSETPLLWQGDDVRRSTVLTRAGQPNTSVAPLEFMDDSRASYAVGLNWVTRGCAATEEHCAALHPVVVAFPTTLPDGSPLVRGIDDVLELHTLVDGRRAILSFNLGHLDVKSVDDLRVR